MVRKLSLSSSRENLSGIIMMSQDEMFLVWKGRFRVEFRDRTVELHAGELLVVPRGIEHRTAADEEVEVVLFEPAETRNTGNISDDTYTAPSGVSI
jgi:mannose-6-phosphate isomerase-like protein (cupin superfamily)